MSGNPGQLTAAQPLLITRIIFGALLTAVFIYVVVGWVVVGRGVAPETAAPPMIKFVLIGMGVMSAMTSFVIKMLMLRGPGQAAAPGSVPAPEGETMPGAGMTISPAVASRFVSAHIAALAASEAPAIVGLAAAIITWDLVPLYGLALVSAAAMAAHFPRRQALEDLQRASLG